MHYDTIGRELVEMFGDKLPDPIHEPIRFAYYVKLYFYEKALNNEPRR